MPSLSITRMRWMLFALIILGGLLSVSAQDDALTLPDVPPTTDEIQPTPDPVTDGAEWRGLDDTPIDSLGLPDSLTGDTRESATEWRGSRAPIAPDATASIAPRNPAGFNVSEAFDFVGAYPWHQAGFTGSAAIKIAIIDFGFGTSTSIPNNRKPDLTCLSSYPNVALASGFGSPAAVDTGRGLDMAEVICDIAPSSKVTLYKAKTSAKLYDAIVAAKAANQIIVIGADFGASFSPGDGTFGRSDAKNVYTALADAKAGGAVVIVAAGNAHSSYKSFTYTGTTSAMTINAQPGDTIDISWSDWDSHQAGGGSREDISAALTGAGFSSQAKSARAGDTPAFQWVVPNCTTDIDGYCTSLVLTLSGLTGDAASVVVQVSVSGIGRVIGTPTTGTGLSFSGTLSRPADSPDVITVGAVCADRSNNFPLVAYSGRGPIFKAGGIEPDLPGGFITADLVKPDISGPAQIGTYSNGVIDLTTCIDGFSGTQAAAAHVAGMVALLKQNPLNSAFTGAAPQNNILTYLRTHAIDLPMEDPDGYDYESGAGLSVLGSPTFDNDVTFGAIPPFLLSPLDHLPSGACTGSNGTIDPGEILYVGPYNVGSPGMNGSLGAPFTSLAQAAKLQVSASSNKCVIVLPGETVSPFVFRYANGVKIFSYNTVATGNYGDSQIFINNVSDGQIDANFLIRRAAIVVEGMPNWYMSGFTFHGAESFDTSVQYRPQVLVLNNTSGTVFRNNVLTDFPQLQSIALIEVLSGSTNVLIEDNSFLNINGNGMSGVIGVEDSGTNVDHVVIANNLFDSIINESGSWGFVKDASTPVGSVGMSFTPILHTLDSYTTIQSNTFTNNKSKTLIQFMTRAKDAPYETAILGNIILNNTIHTADSLDNAGPLINGFHAKRVYIFNNTIANNLITTTGANALLFGRGRLIIEGGNDPTWNGSLDVASWEIHNNFIYRNGGAPMTGDINVSNTGCADIAGNADSGVTHNWLYNLTSSLNPGQCSASVANITFANITVNPYVVDGNNEPIPESTYILGGSDPKEPLYYSFIGNDTNPTADGVDDGYDALVTGLFSSFANGLDARNSGRRTDGDNNASILIDIGAYEAPGPGFRFTLSTPYNNSVVSDMSAPFSWTPATDATSYTFTFSRINNGGNVNVLFTLPGLTPATGDDAMACLVDLGCVLTLTESQQALLGESGVFRWSVTATDGLANILAGNAPFKIYLSSETVLPLLNAGFETQGANAKVALNWRPGNKQKDDIRKCGAGFGANGSNCSFQLKTTATSKVSVIKQPLEGIFLGQAGDTLTITTYVRQKTVVATKGVIRVNITYPGNVVSVLRIALPAGGSNTWSPTPVTGSLVLTGSPVKMMVVFMAKKANKGIIWIDDVQLTLN